MGEHPSGAILEHFADLEDPRVEYLCDHKLIDIVGMAICAVICGADSWVEVESYGKAREEWLRTFLDLRNGIPSHDTFGRVFASLDADQFRRCFMDWVAAVSELSEGQVVAIDGKTLRCSHDKTAGLGAIHMVSAWANANELVLGQIKVDEKSNEITAIPALLSVLALSGCIVTIDAMGCQKGIAQAILDQEADYVLAVKENQPTLHRKITEMFDHAIAEGTAHTSYDYSEQIEKNHGRIETRRCWVISDPDYLFYIQGPREKEHWPGLQSLVRVEATRRVGEQCSQETRYYIASLACEAKPMNAAVRGHWGVENSLHWVLDIAFREDESRIRKGNGPQLFGILRHMALNLLKQDKTIKTGIHGKRLRAAWDPPYLLRVLAG